MFGLNENTQYYVCQRYVRMNMGINGLYQIVRTEMELPPLGGAVFIFFSKNRQQVKMLYGILFIKQTLKKIMYRGSGRKSCQHLHDEIANSGKIALKRIGIRAVNCLGGILFQVFLCQFFLLWGEIGKRACLEKLDQSCMYQFITRLASDIAADKFTVHADALS